MRATTREDRVVAFEGVFVTSKTTCKLKFENKSAAGILSKKHSFSARPLRPDGRRRRYDRPRDRRGSRERRDRDEFSCEVAKTQGFQDDRV